MRLTRRDALVSLAAVGVGGASGSALSGGIVPPRVGGEDSADGVLGGGDGGSDEVGVDDPRVLDTLSAAAEVLYPSAVDGRRGFVETYVLGRVADRPTYRDGLVRATADLDATARDWFGAAFADLAGETRDRLLRELGVDTAKPDPDGNVSDRIRFYVVNDLLFALYTSPIGGKLVGIENPVGYPGGIESYRRAEPDRNAREQPGERGAVDPSESGDDDGGRWGDGDGGRRGNGDG